MESPKKNPDYVNTVGVVVIGLAGALLVYASFVGLQAFYYKETTILELERDAEGKSAELRTLRSEQEKTLQGYRRLDAARNTVTLPIEVAMQRVVEAATADPGATLVPVVGAHDTPTIPAIAGKPTGAQMPAAPAAPAAPEAPATTDGAPADGAAPAVPASLVIPDDSSAGTGLAGEPAAPAQPAAAGNPEGNAPQ